MGGVGAGDEEGGIGRKLWVKSRNKWVLAVYTPFILRLASGNLDSHSFLHFLSQHLLFLQASLKTYEMAEECADDDDDKSAIRKLRTVIIKKLELYPTFVQECGFELPKENVPDNVTVRYTDFLLATASGKAVGEGFLGKIVTPFERTKLAAYAIAAMAPSMRLQAFLSKEIQAHLNLDKSANIYKKWTTSFSSKQSEALAYQTEELLDQLAVSLTGEELEVVEKLYNQAMQLEVDFFAAQSDIQQAVLPLSRAHDGQHNITIFCGFDTTCSAVDSSTFLAEIAIRKALMVNNENDLRCTWSTLSSQYVEGCERCIESIMLGETAKGFNYEWLCKAFNQLSAFEKGANTKVVESAVLKGLNIEDIKWAGRNLVFQDGCRDFFRAIKNNDVGTDVHVISYCWSGDLIRFAFRSGDMPISSIHSNKLVYDGFMTTGDISKIVESPMEKLQAFTDIRTGYRDEEKKLSVYIGGSVGDLPCLLQADVGIVISPGTSLKRVGYQFGVSFVPLFSGAVKKQREFDDGGSCWKGGLSGVLYTVSSWAEIHAFILGSS